MTKLLILGGTGWLGPELIRSGLDRGWAVTSLTRGRSKGLPSGARRAVGDRTKSDGYAAVADRDWDVVIDTTWQPGQGRSAVDQLSERAGQWIFVSSNGAYADLQRPGPADQRSSLVEAYTGDHADADDYRGAKVACEEAVLAARGSECLIVRSGLLIGPGDISDRYGYWVSRFATAGDQPVLVPEEQSAVIQAIDVRDLAAWVIASAASGLRGTIDVVGPRYEVGELVEVSRRVAGYRGEVVEAGDAFLREQGVSCASGGARTLPLWDPRGAGYPLVSAAPVLASGIGYRSLAETTRDTLADERARGTDRERRAGLTRSEELELLEQLRSSSQGRP